MYVKKLLTTLGFGPMFSPGLPVQRERSAFFWPTASTTWRNSSRVDLDHRIAEIQVRHPERLLYYNCQVIARRLPLVTEKPSAGCYL